MEGIQKTVYEGIQDILNKVSDGFYGQNDDEFSKDAMRDDIEDILSVI